MCRVSTSTNQGVAIDASFLWTLATPTAPVGGRLSTTGFVCPGAACTAQYSAGQIPVRLTAIPSAGWDIYALSGCTPVAGAPLQCDASPTNTNGLVNVGATFGHPLQLTANQSGTISRNSAQTAVGCSSGAANCFVYPNGTQVNLTANAPNGRTFLSWTGCPNNTYANPCSISMSDERIVVADFGYALTADTMGGGTVTQSTQVPSCGAGCVVHADNTLVTLTATPDSGWDFYDWQNCPAGGASGNTCQVTVTAARTVTARFGRRLTVNITGNGTVDRMPTTGVACSNGNSACRVYLDPTTVTLTANPTSPSRFIRWDGCPSGNNNPVCTVTTDAEYSMTARFGHRLTVNVNGAGTVTDAAAGINCTSAGGAGCTADLADGTAVALVAGTPSGWAFETWSANCNSGTATCNLTINADISVVAEVRPGLSFVVPSARSGDTISVSPAGSASTFPCVGSAGCSAQAYLPHNQSATLSLSAPAGRRTFWGGACATATGTDCVLLMDQPRAATLDLGYDLVISTAFASVDLSRAPLAGPQSCPAPGCTAVLTADTVTLTYTGSSTTTAVWAGDCVGLASTPCVLDMASPRAVSVVQGN